MRLLFLIFVLLLNVASLYAQKEEEMDYLVTIGTDLGDMKLILFDDTPEHQKNFIKLIDEGFYDSLLFHRVIDQFMIQGGDPASKDAQPGQPLGSGGPGYTLPAEINPDNIHRKGALAAARQGDQVNPQKRSSGSQFYIVTGKTFSETEMEQMNRQRIQGHMNKLVQQVASLPENKDLYNEYVSFMRENNKEAADTILQKFIQQAQELAKDNPPRKYTPEEIKIYMEHGGSPWLDGEYTVFGQMVEGFEVADKIGDVEKGQGDRPVKDIQMNISYEKISKEDLKKKYSEFYD